MGARDDLRSRTLGSSPAWKTATVEWGGCKFTVRAPTAGEYDAIMRKAELRLGADGQVALDPIALAVAQRHAALLLTRVPDTGELLFDPADAEAFLTRQHDPNDFVDALGRAAMRLVRGAAEEAAAAGKASSVTPLAVAVIEEALASGSGSSG